MTIDSRDPCQLSQLDLDADPANVLKPCSADWLEAYPVDKRVGNVRNNDDELIEPLSS